MYNRGTPNKTSYLPTSEFGKQGMQVTFIFMIIWIYVDRGIYSRIQKKKKPTGRVFFFFFIYELPPPMIF